MALHLRILHLESYYSPEPDCSIFRCISVPPILSPPFPLPPPPSPFPPPLISPHKNKHILTNHALLFSTILIAFFLLSILSSAFFLFLRRRRRRRRARTVIQGPTPSLPSHDADQDPIHHVWYIRTVGLDEAAIESIAVTEYREGMGVVCDCAVCLGDFGDGDLVRLLPKCGHVFHVECIDTWLRAHVNCPLCRARVVDDSIEGVIEEGESSELRSEFRRSGSDLGEGNEEGNEHAQEEVFVEIPLSDSVSDDASELTVRSVSEEREARPGRYRSASVDSPFMDSSVVTALEIGTGTGTDGDIGKETNFGGEQSCKEMEKGHSEMGRSLSSSSSRVFFFSRNGRSRSSVLPL